MKPILAKILAINILFLSCAIFSYSEEIIFPKKKPILSNEVINKINGVITPIKKPSISKKKIVKKKYKS